VLEGKKTPSAWSALNALKSCFNRFAAVWANQTTSTKDGRRNSGKNAFLGVTRHDACILVKVYESPT